MLRTHFPNPPKGQEDLNGVCPDRLTLRKGAFLWPRAWNPLAFMALSRPIEWIPTLTKSKIRCMSSLSVQPKQQHTSQATAGSYLKPIWIHWRYNRALADRPEKPSSNKTWLRTIMFAFPGTAATNLWVHSMTGGPSDHPALITKENHSHDLFILTFIII